MNLGLILQYAFIVALVLYSTWYMFRKLAPGLSGRWQMKLATFFNKPWRARWMQIIGRKLQPKIARSQCGDGCNTCGGCAPQQPLTAQHHEQPLTLRPSRRS